MKQLKFLLTLCVFFVFCTPSFSVQKVQLKNGILLNFESCADGSVRFEALAKKASSPAKEFELKKEPSQSQFEKSEDYSFVWGSYKITITDDGYNLFKDGTELYSSAFKDEGKTLREVRTWKNSKDFYGFGEASRFFNLKNTSYTIYNVSKYGDHAFLFIPFYVTESGTCVYYNANGNDNIYFQSENDPQVYRSEYKRIECFVRQDKNPKESVQKFYTETKSQTLIPKWAFGYIQSKYGYKSQQEVIDLITEFKNRNIPLSAVVLDLYWFNRMGDISWTSKDFPNPNELNNFMEENGVKLITITEPFFTTECENFAELKKDGLLCKNQKGKLALWHEWWCLNKDKEGGIFNPLAKKAADFMGRKYNAMLESGIDGFWTDLGEPEGAPKNLKYGKYKEQDFHNYYNYYWTKSLYEGLKAINPEKRLFILSRSGYTGIGKYNISVWSGDVDVSWSSLAHQIPFALNAGISGLAYWGSDVGGFSKESTSPELFVRWQQFGAFTPVYRAHGTGPREPWIFSEKETQIVTKYINYRTELLPYIYSTARQTMNGLPMMRPMFFEDTEESQTPEDFMGSQYFFGDAFLVCPITREISVESEKSLWLPKGTWYEFETLKPVQGGKIINVQSKIDSIPVYIKEGSIIPTQKNNKTYLYVFPKTNSEESSTFTLYNDDGETDFYKNGSFTETTFTLSKTKISAKVSENTTYAENNFLLAVPINTKTNETWKQEGNIKTKSVTLEELKSGITF